MSLALFCLFLLPFHSLCLFASFSPFLKSSGIPFPEGQMWKWETSFLSGSGFGVWRQIPCIQIPLSRLLSSGWFTCIKEFFWGLNDNLFKVLSYYYVDYFCFCSVCFCPFCSVSHPFSSKPIPMPLDTSNVSWALTLNALHIISSLNPHSKPMK